MKHKYICPLIMGSILISNQSTSKAVFDDFNVFKKSNSKQDELKIIEENTHIKKDVTYTKSLDDSDFKELEEDNWIKSYVAKSLNKNISSLTEEDYKKITKVDVNGCNIKNIPSEINKLINLKSLDLSNNDLTKVELKENSLNNLEEIYIQGNRLKEIPLNLNKMKTLRKIDLSDNQLVGGEAIIKEIKENNPGLTLFNLDKNLINNKELNPNPKKLKTSINSLDIKVSSPFDLSNIKDKFTIDDKPLNPAFTSFKFSYSLESTDTEPYFDRDTLKSLRIGTLKGILSIKPSVEFESENDNSNLISDEEFTLNIVEEKNAYPVLEVPNEIVIFEGDNLNALEKAHAYDINDGILTEAISSSLNSVDVNKAGNYKVSYEVENSKGLISKKEQNILVKEDLPPAIKAKDIEIKANEKVDFLNNIKVIDDKDGDITSKTIVKGLDEIDFSKPGYYIVNLIATDSKGNTSTKDIYVKIVDDYTPIIQAKDKSIKVGSEFNPLKGISAFDIEDGDLTKNLKVVKNNVDAYKEGIYEVSYNVLDSNGNESKKDIKIQVENNIGESPIINTSDLVINLNSNINPLDSVTSYDKEDGVLTDKVKTVKNELDTSKPGKYYITYEVLDSDGNKACKNQKITVKENKTKYIEKTMDKNKYTIRYSKPLTRFWDIDFLSSFLKNLNR